jgi:hypothetical protein
MTPATITLAGTVQEFVNSSHPEEPHLARIKLAGVDSPYDEFHIANVHAWKVGSNLKVTIRVLPGGSDNQSK